MATEGSEMRWQLAGGSGSRWRARMHASSFISRMHASPGRRVITLVRPWPPWREDCLPLPIPWPIPDYSERSVSKFDFKQRVDGRVVL